MNETKTVKKLIPLLRFHKWAFPAIVVLGLLQSLSEGIGIGLLIPLLSGLAASSQPSTNTHWLVEKMGRLFQSVPPDHRLVVISACVFAAVLVNALLGYVHHILFGWVDGKIAHDLRHRIFRQLMTMNFGAIERDKSGRLLNLLASDTWRCRDALRLVVDLMITTSTVAV
jgi:subfamily B ATP-binding cassette protein MsbA